MAQLDQGGGYETDLERAIRESLAISGENPPSQRGNNEPILGQAHSNRPPPHVSKIIILIKTRKLVILKFMDCANIFSLPPNTWKIVKTRNSAWKKSSFQNFGREILATKFMHSRTHCLTMFFFIYKMLQEDFQIVLAAPCTIHQITMTTIWKIHQASRIGKKDLWVFRMVVMVDWRTIQGAMLYKYVVIHFS